MRTSLLFLLAGLAFTGCKKDSTTKNLQIEAAYFYRLGIENIDGSVQVSKIVSTRKTIEIPGEANDEGNHNNEHYEGDGCNENSDKFCEKHPWHKKCNGVMLPLTLDYFEVQTIRNQTFVQWRTLMESNVNRFFIQRSDDGKSFKNVGFVEPKGAFTTYKYND